MHSIACPNCQKRLKLTADQLKRKLRCSACATRFIVGGQIGAGAGGDVEYLGIEVFDQETVEDFEILPDKPAKPAPAPKPATVPEPAMVPEPALTDELPPDQEAGPVYSDSIFPNEFGLIDDAPPQLVPDEPEPLPKAKPVPVKRAAPVQPVRAVKAKPVVAPKPVAAPRVKPAVPVPPAAPVAKNRAPAADAFDLGDEDTEKLDIHLEMRTPDAPPAPPPRPAPPPPPRAPKPAVPKPAPPPAAPIIDDVEIIEEEFEITSEPPPSVRTTKGGIPIVDAATDEEIAEYEARQAAGRRQQGNRRR